MIAEFHHKLGSPEQVEVTRLVLRASPQGEALCVAVEAGPGQWYIVHRGDGDEAMNKALQSMGIDETVISDMVDMPTPPGKLWTPGS
jgi:sarcosine oxidase gamma subunit